MQTLTEITREQIFQEYVKTPYEQGDTAKLPTEKELANKYNVSLITVRRAIESMVRENYLLRLRRHGTFVVDSRTLTPKYTIAMIVPEDRFYWFLASQIESSLVHKGHKAERFHVDDAEAFIQRLGALEKKPDGIIVCGYVLDQQRLNDCGIPFVVAGCEGYQNADHVVFDLRAGARTAVEHLIAHGHRRILFLSHFDPDMRLPNALNHDFHFESSPRYLGYVDAFRNAGLSFRPEWVVHTGNAKRNAYRILGELLARPGFDATAVFAANDRLAEGAAAAIKERGRAIPRDLSLVGCNNTMEDGEMLLPLTTLDLSLDRVGDCSLRLLFDQLADRDAHEYRSIAIIPQLVRPDETVARVREG